LNICCYNVKNKIELNRKGPNLFCGNDNANPNAAMLTANCGRGDSKVGIWPKK
jgi:hypothetical protein